MKAQDLLGGAMQDGVVQELLHPIQPVKLAVLRLVSSTFCTPNSVSSRTSVLITHFACNVNSFYPTATFSQHYKQFK